MNDKEMLKQLGFQRILQRGDELVADCVFCGGKKKFYFNLETHVCICFRGCFAGSSVSLLSRIRGITTKEAKAELENGINWFTTLHGVLDKPKEYQARRTQPVMPMVRVLNELEINYLEGRKIDHWLAVEHGAVGCDDLPGLVALYQDCTREEATSLITVMHDRFTYLKNRIFIPIDEKKVLLEGRSIDPNCVPKVIYPTGISQDDTLFTTLDAEKKDWIIVVEGTLDVLKIEEWEYPAGAILKSSVSVGQGIKLTKFKRVYLAFDPDSGGKIALKSAVSRLINSTELMEMKLPLGKDPKRCSFNEFTNAFVSAKQISYVRRKR